MDEIIEADEIFFVGCPHCGSLDLKETAWDSEGNVDKECVYCGTTFTTNDND